MTGAGAEDMDRPVPSKAALAEGRFLVVAGFLLFSLCLAAGVWLFSYREALRQLEIQGRSDLALAGDRLTSGLQTFRSLAVQTALHPGVIDSLLRGETAMDVPTYLQELADKTGALDIVVLSKQGREIYGALSGVPARHGGQPYFERAMDGALGVYHRLSERYDARVYLFAAPVFGAGGPPLGAVLVVVDVDKLEAVWRGDRPGMFFTDDLGVIFISNRSELVLRSKVLSGALVGRSADYPIGRLSEYMASKAYTRFGLTLWELDAGRYLPQNALYVTRDFPVIGLTGEALLDVIPSRQNANLRAAATLSLCLAFGALLYLASERRRTLTVLNSELERRVKQRTSDLSTLNEHLRQEVADRRRAEDQLRKAQADLVQAGKLSALGQMSAGISHELNQPLMAIRSYAENAQAFIERQETDRAEQNLGRISDLARRMGRIIRNLRAFTRQESEPMSEVDLVGVVEAALELAAERVTRIQAEVTWHRPADPVFVRGGEVRLSQVALNLIANALDAMIESATPSLEIDILRDADTARLIVRDRGPGIAEPEKIFDPFYTTKTIRSEEGMGLGLSISYGLVQSFGGDIRGSNREGGGAEFVVTLTLASCKTGEL